MTDAEQIAITEAHREARPARKAALLELIVFLMLIAPTTVTGLVFKRPGGLMESLGFRGLALLSIMQNVALVSLIQFFLWRGGESPALIGWRARRLWREALLGLALYIPFAILTVLVIQALIAAGLPSPPRTLPPYLAARGGAEYVLAVLLCVVVGIAEETIYRGYLGQRIRELTGYRAAMVLLPTILFAIPHAYQGLTGAVAAGFIGLVFALLYLWRGSLVAPMVMHFLQDLIALVIWPLLYLK